jgi:hypothetical protein
MANSEQCPNIFVTGTPSTPRVVFFNLAPMVIKTTCTTKQHLFVTHLYNCMYKVQIKKFIIIDG